MKSFNHFISLCSVVSNILMMTSSEYNFNTSVPLPLLLPPSTKIPNTPTFQHLKEFNNYKTECQLDIINE